MISWVPFLRRHGIFNSTLQAMGLIAEPVEFLLFSDFAVVLAFVHLYTLFMVTPISDSMIRIDRSILAAATDCGASDGQVLRDVIIPLSKPGMAIGSIFVVTLVMGDFITVRLMSGGQSASVGLMMNQIALLQYPAAAANAVILLIVTLLMIMAMVRIVDIRKEL
jgi:putative spermidine/putrescine transport system permease protein